MPHNRGKKFETIIKDSFLKVPGVSVDRLHDQTTGFKGSQNICDFIVYRRPYEYYIECKSVHGNTLPFNNITDTQWNGLLEKSNIYGVCAGVICWWVDKDVTKFIPIQLLQTLKEHGGKSIRYDVIMGDGFPTIQINGRKKHIYFDYDMENFLDATNRFMLYEESRQRELSDIW